MSMQRLSMAYHLWVQGTKKKTSKPLINPSFM